MNRKKSVLLAMWAVLSLSFYQAFAFDVQVDALAGFRHDEITSLNQIYRLPVYEASLKGRLSLGNILIKGFQSRGRVDSEKGVDTGRTSDSSIGVGYLISLFNFYAGPVVGWSLHDQKIKIKAADLSGLSYFISNNLTSHFRWQGPWLGIEGGFSLLCIRFNAGYEYHWPHRKWHLSKLNLSENSYPNQSSAHSGKGQVIFINAAYAFLGCVAVGAEIKYQYWKAKNGDALNIGSEFSEISQATSWKSWETLLSLGLQF